MNFRQIDVFNKLIDADPIDGGEIVDASDPYFDTPPSLTRRVSSRQFPHLSCFYQHYSALICIDTTAESNLISEAFPKKLVYQSSQLAIRLLRLMISPCCVQLGNT